MSELSTTARSGLAGRRSVIIAVVFGLALITFLVYLPTLKNGFIYWDDPQYVYENLPIRTLGPAFFKWAITAVVVSNWHPLTLLSHAIDYRIWGLNPVGHHLTSVLVHSLNTALFFLLSIRLIELGSRGRRGFMNYTLINPAVLIAASAAALLFGVHPIHVESVSWVSERKDVLSALFFILSIYYYLGYVTARGGKTSVMRRLYVASLFMFILSLMSKPMAVSLPVVLFILDYYPLERFPGSYGWVKGLRYVLIEKIPFITLAALSSVVTLWAQKTTGAMQSFTQVPLSVRIPLAFRSYLFYLYKMVLPKGLAPFYSHPLSASFFSLEYLLPLVLFIIITLFAVLFLRRWKVFAAVWSYYIITLLPVIGLVQVGGQAAADRYTYLPGLGPTLLVAIGFGLFFERCNRKVLRNVVLSFGMVVLVVFSLLTIRQEAVWRSTVSFWSRQIDIYPSAKAYTSRAEAYRKEGNLKSALRDYSSVIEKGPGATSAGTTGLSEVLNNRGGVYKKMGLMEPAVRDFSSAISLDPKNAKAYNNRGNIYRQARRYDLAVRDLLTAVSIDPSIPALHFNLGLAYAEAGKGREAYAELKAASRMGLKAADSAIETLGLKE